MEKERWEKIKGFKDVVDNVYMVSSYGRVYNILKNKIMYQKITSSKKKYYAVSMKTKTRGHQWILVHQLVAEYFCTKPIFYIGKTELVPDHLDNNGLNNQYTNLEWKSRAQNVSEAFSKGFVDKRGEKSPDALINDTTARKIGILLSEGKFYDEIIDIMGFENTKQYQTLLVRIRNRHAYIHVTSDLIFPYAKYQLNKKVIDMLNKLNEIIYLHDDENMRPSEIVRKIWGTELSKRDYDNKLNSVAMILRGDTFVEEVQHIRNSKSSTTIENDDMYDDSKYYVIDIH